MKRIGIGAVVAILLFVTLGLLRVPQTASAQGKDSAATVTIHYPPADTYGYYVALYREGHVIRSGSAGYATNVRWENVPEGEYELRIEADGRRAHIMRVGIAHGENNNFTADLLKEEGTKVFGKGPTLDDLEQRIKKLEATVEELKKKSP